MSRILIVEDDPDIAVPLRDDLALEGYDVEAVGDGETALRRLEENRFDLLLLDVMLPGTDGFEVCRRLRQAGSRLPILLLTAKTQEAEIVMGLELGADDYITKPFSPRELRARIKAALRRNDDSHQVFSFGDVEVDFERVEVRRAGASVELTPIEFKLLSTFVRSPGRVLNRQQLLDRVWGPGTYVTERVVDTHIGNLRKKIEPDPKHPRYLISVLGAGYRFDLEPEGVKNP